MHVGNAKNAYRALFLAWLVTTACHAVPAYAADEPQPERAAATWWGGRVVLDVLDWLDLTHGVDDLEECKRGRARDREEAVSKLAEVQAAHAIAIAEERGRTERADARADGIEAAGRRAAEAASSAPSWWTVAGVGGLALAIGVIVGAVVGR